MARLLLSRRRRLAFTLIELLVVISLIAILATLLIPVVQRIRANAARAQTQNNMMQVILAVHAFHDVHRRLPDAGRHGTCGDTLMVYCGLFHLLLPYVNQDPLWKQFHDGSQYFYGARFNDYVIPVYISPEDPTHNDGLASGWGACNYSFNYQLFGNGGNWNCTWRLATIPDGSSTTIAFATRYAHFPQHGWYGFWCAAPWWVHHHQAFFGYYDDCTPPQIAASPYGATGNSGQYPAAHPYYTQGFTAAGATIAMGDGAVRQLSADVSSAAWRNVVGPANGLIPSHDFYFSK